MHGAVICLKLIDTQDGSVAAIVLVSVSCSTSSSVSTGMGAFGTQLSIITGSVNQKRIAEVAGEVWCKSIFSQNMRAFKHYSP